MTDKLFWFHSGSKIKDAFYKKCSTITDNDDYSSRECSNSECEDFSQQIYISSIETRMRDNKYEIFNFYKILSIKLLDNFSIRYIDVTVSLRHLIRNFSRLSYGILPSTIDYNDKSYCIGYLHRYAACHAALVFDAVSDILNPSLSDVLLTKLQQKSLNVMFLGGGPGNDFVGFLIALCSHHYHLFDLDITVVDKMSGWEDVFKETVKRLKRGDCGVADSIFDEVNVTTTFISADLMYSEEWEENMQTKLRTADILFFVKTLSHTPDIEKLQVLQNVVSCMKLESHLIYIDYPYPYGVFASLNNQLKTVYQAWEMRYFLGHKQNAFGCNNISSCGAVVKIFERYENTNFNLYF